MNHQYLYIAILFIILIGISETLRRIHIKSLYFWVIFCFLLLPIMLGATGVDWKWFAWVKTYSVLLGCAWISLIRFTSYIQPKIGYRVVFFILAANILEASILDFTNGHIINAIAGLLVILTMPKPKKITTEHQSSIKDLNYDTSYLWIIAYTVWNSCFLYINWDARLWLQTTAVLGAPLLMAVLFGRKTWLQARAYTLGIYIILHDIFFDWMKKDFNAGWLYNETAATLYQTCSLIVVSAVVVDLLINRFRK